MKKLVLMVLMLVLVGAGCGKTPGTTMDGGPKEKYKEIVNPAGFINTPNNAPITLGELVGKKVVMIDFLTYSCINCIRTFPYLNAWYDKYKDQGLEIVGIHTPEFAFEKKYDNVVKAAKEYGLKFPLVLDNNYATWNAYGNSYWPRKYLIDINGDIIYDHIGEGGYEETEAKIQMALMGRKSKLGETGTVVVDMAKPAGLEAPEGVASPEVYFGASRNELLGNGISEQAGKQTFSAPGVIEQNKLYLVGEWDITGEYAVPLKAGAKIIFRYTSKRVNIVASDTSAGTMTVLRDGQPVGTAAGADVKNGKVTITADQLYEVVDDPAGAGEHTLELLIDKPGVKVFTFTFG